MSKITFTDQNFGQEVEQEKDKPVLVDFWAEWCGPCRVQGPIVDEVAGEIGDKAKVGDLEVDQSPRAASKYGVMSIPTIIIFKSGKVVWQGVGVQEKQTLIQQLQKAAG